MNDYREDRVNLIKAALKEVQQNGVAYLSRTLGSVRSIDGIRLKIQERHPGQYNGAFAVRYRPDLDMIMICTSNSGYFYPGYNKKLAFGQPISDALAKEIVRAMLKLRREGEDWEEDKLTLNCVNKNPPIKKRLDGSLFTICFNCTPMGAFHQIVVFRDRMQYFGLKSKTYQVKEGSQAQVFELLRKELIV